MGFQDFQFVLDSDWTNKLIMSKELIYLATPYSHEDKSVSLHRFNVVNDVAAKLMKEGKIVFSPISHSHTIAVENDLPVDWEYWKESCETFVTRCDRLMVLTVDGWKESTGVQEEIKIAEREGIPIEYISVIEHEKISNNTKN